MTVFDGSEYRIMNVPVGEVVAFLRDLMRKNKTNNFVLLYLKAKFGIEWR